MQDLEDYHLLEIKDIYKTYNNIQVLESVSLILKPGTCTGLIGSNGSGKSTLMRIIAQITKPDQGELLYEGNNILGKSSFFTRHIGYVPQEDGLADFLTVKQQLEFWQSAVNDSNNEIIETLGLKPLWNKPIKTLSGGQKKRVSIAMAFQNHPQYIIMDEAFSALDTNYKNLVTHFILSEVSNGLSVLWCSHDMQEVSDLCTEVFVLVDGKLQKNQTL